MSRVPQINIGLFGFGTVGSRVYEILCRNESLITRKLGYPVKVKKICVADIKKKLSVPVPTSMLTSKASEVLDDPEISIIVELIGNKPAALEVMNKALELGKHVVTANKAILANNGTELLSLAAKNEVEILFEAAVGGSIPVLRSLREGFIADKIRSVHGIINGTCNFILSEMSQKKREFADVLSEAQKLGYAEANPASDVEGHDAAQKLCILSSMAFGQVVSPDKVYSEGISKLATFDIDMAEKFGYVAKLLAISKCHENDIEARVHPTLIPKSNLLAQVGGAYNAVMLNGEFFGKSLLYGLGAGGHATATAVLADIIEVARNIAHRVPGVPPYGIKIDQIVRAKIRPIEEIESEYYLHFTALDKPGIFAKIANVLGTHHISIASVYQHGREEGKEVSIVVFSHKSKEKNIQTALREIDKLSGVTQKTLLIRVENE